MEIQRLKNLYLNKILKHINKVNNELQLYNQCKEQIGGSDEVSIDDTNIQLVTVLYERINKLDTLNRTKKSKISELTSELLLTTEQLHQKQLELDQKQLKLQMSHDELERTKNNLTMKQSELDIMQSNLDTMQNRLTVISGSNGNNLGEIDRLKQQISLLENNINDKTNEISTLREKVHTLTEEITQLNQQADTLNQQVETLNQQVEVLTRDNSQKDSMITNLKKEQTKLEQHVDTILSESINSLTENNQKLIASTNNYINILVSQINTMKTQMNDTTTIDARNYVISNDNPYFNADDSLNDKYDKYDNFKIFYKNKLQECDKNIVILKELKSITNQKMIEYINSMKDIDDD